MNRIWIVRIIGILMLLLMLLLLLNLQIRLEKMRDSQHPAQTGTTSR